MQTFHTLENNSQKVIPSSDDSIPSKDGAKPLRDGIIT
jgi:hypothetical protein